MSVHISIHICACEYVSVCAHKYPYVCMCVHISIHLYVYMHTHTHFMNESTENMCEIWRGMLGLVTLMCLLFLWHGHHATRWRGQPLLSNQMEWSMCPTLPWTWLPETMVLSWVTGWRHPDTDNSQRHTAFKRWSNVKYPWRFHISLPSRGAMLLLSVHGKQQARGLEMARLCDNKNVFIDTAFSILHNFHEGVLASGSPLPSFCLYNHVTVAENQMASSLPPEDWTLVGFYPGIFLQWRKS